MINGKEKRDGIVEGIDENDAGNDMIENPREKMLRGKEDATIIHATRRVGRGKVVQKLPVAAAMRDRSAALSMRVSLTWRRRVVSASSSATLFTIWLVVSSR